MEVEQIEMDTSQNVPGRLALLTESFTKCINYGLRAPTLQEIEGHYPTLPKSVQSALLELFKQVLVHINVHSQAEFTDICKEYSMEVKLTEIERLCSQAQGSQPSTNVSSDEAVAAAKAAETCARVSAKALEVAHLQAMLAQAVSTRDHLAALKQQKLVAVQEIKDVYAAAASEIQQVYDVSGANHVALVSVDDEHTGGLPVC